MSSTDLFVTEATAEALEFPSLLRLISELTAFDAGARRVLCLGPAVSEEALERRRGRYEEVARLVEDRRLVPSFEEPVEPLLRILEGDRAELDGDRLLVLASLLAAVEQAAGRIRTAEVACPELAALAEPLQDLAPLRQRIATRLDGRGRIRDDASPRLSDLRGTVRSARNSLYRDLEEYLERNEGELTEETVPLHDGRLVVMLSSGARGRLEGLVHGRSGSGKSYYFEPLEVVEKNNRLREAQEEEELERRRLLAELVAEAREAAPSIRAHADFLAELDLQQAAARFAQLTGGRLAEISAGLELELRGAYHPLLDPRLADLRERALGHPGHTGPVVPLRLTLNDQARILVVTGPNAGGKTVALKTVGLLVLASQCGLPVAVDRGSRLPALRRLVATVGDEQDLLEDRSTFSGRLLRLREAWRAAGPETLVLLDELGSGTDPDEGAALAVALLEGLAERGSFGILTTHLTQLAAAALERPGAACAAMEFDAISGAPTYELHPGSPGGSQALALARKLDLPAEWIDRAEELLGPDHRDLRRVLHEVEELRRGLREDSERLRRDSESLGRERQELEERGLELENETREESRRLARELEAFRREIADQLGREKSRLEEELRRGRKRRVVSESVERLFSKAPELAIEEESRPAVLGDTVEHRSLGWRGVVKRLDRSRTEVSVHGKTLRCAPDELRVVEADAPTRPTSSPPKGDDLPSATVSAEVNLIGQRVEPALETLDGYLDQALLTAHSQVRVIHGHGTGRLRRAVRQHLEKHPAVSRHRPGRESEGGDGATVAILR